MKIGQFNTTNKNYILTGFEQHISNKHWVDPFAGNGDLLEWADQHGAYSTNGYDIDPTKPFKTQDTLLNPLNYTDTYVIANPPYLFQNKSKDKTLYLKYSTDDLYKVAIKTINGCEGGILIVPLNFLSSDDYSIRNEFFSDYTIFGCNIFCESVFDDTDCVVCSFYFEKNKEYKSAQNIFTTFFPTQETMCFPISAQNGWRIGEKFYEFICDTSTKGVSRFTVDNAFCGDAQGTCCINDFKNPSNSSLNPDVLENIMLLRAIDTGSIEGRIKLIDIRTLGVDCLAGLNTSRNFAHIKIKPTISIDAQVEIIKKFNTTLEYYRQQYNSVFLTSFRNSTKHYSRKRIGFDVAYKLINKFNLHD